MEDLKKCCPDNNSYCKDPVINLFEEYVALAENFEPEELVTTPGKKFKKYLDSGLLLSNNNMCCPDCDHKFGFYYLGGYDPFLNLSVLFHQAVDPEETYVAKKYPCCVNTYLTGESLVSYGVNFKDLQVPCCDNSFNQSISEDIQESGGIPSDLIEASGFNGSSSLGNLFEYFGEMNINRKFFVEFISVIIEVGLVIKCFDCKMFVGSVSSFETFGNSINLFP